MLVVVREKDQPRIVQQTKRKVKSDDVVQMRCNARRSRRSGKSGRERRAPGRREERREGKGKESAASAWGDLSGQTSRVLYPQLSPDTGAISRYRQSGQLGPHLFSIPHFPVTLPQIEIPFPSSLPPQNLLNSPPPPPLSLQLLRPLCAAPPSTLPLFPPILHPGFPRGPYLDEAVPPRCFNHLYLFHFSALFFSAFPIRQARLSSHPLSTYMRGDAPGISPDAYLSLIPSELVSAKISLSARLARVFLIITSIHKPSPYLAHNGNRHHTVSHQLNRSNVTGRTSW
jgi:hypothetical protein